MAEANRIVVPPVEAGAARPLWSVMIPTYNCADYLRETLASVLAQDPGPEQMQIEVVDDCSTRDDPEAVVRELAGERVVFHRQARNVGHVRNFETCLLRSRGELVHLLHGDDRVRPGFYRTMQEPFLSDPRIGAAFCRHIFINEQNQWLALSQLERPDSGILHQWLERIATWQRVQTPAVVVRRTVYEVLGGFDRRLSWTEDWEMWVRIASHYPVWFEPQFLAEYRVHQASSTGRQLSTGENIRDMRRAIEINRAHSIGGDAHDISLRARKMLAHFAIDTARREAIRRNWAAVWVQMLESVRTSRAPSVVVRAGYRSLWAILRRLQSGRRGSQGSGF